MLLAHICKTMHPQAGHMRTQQATVSGVIKVNGEVVTGDKMHQVSGFVHQEDVILDTMTVREALLFAAHLRLPKDVPAAEKEQRALAVADMLNLTKALDACVGSSLIQGIRWGGAGMDACMYVNLLIEGIQKIQPLPINTSCQRMFMFGKRVICSTGTSLMLCGVC